MYDPKPKTDLLWSGLWTSGRALVTCGTRRGKEGFWAERP